MDFGLTDRKLTKDGKHVLKTGLIFRAGEYKDKNFTMTPEELIEAEAAFQPVPIDVEHIHNLGVLNGKLGTLEAVTTSDDGYELYGTAKIPVWLDDLAGDALKVSCTWGRDNKQLAKLAIVQNPRVSDAALFAAFTANEIEEHPEATAQTVKEFFSWVVENETTTFANKKTWDGKSVIQGVHDMLARSGAVCAKADKKGKDTEMSEDAVGAEFISKEEQTVMQKMHDIALKAGAVCYFLDERPSHVGYNTNDASTASEGKNMTWREKVIAVLNGMPEEELATTTVDNSVEVKPEVPVVDAEKEELIRQLAEYKAKEEAAANVVSEEVKASEEPAEEVVDEEKIRIIEELNAYKTAAKAKEAKEFAESLVKDSKILPASTEAVAALFAQAVEDDAKFAATVVKFGEGDEVKEVSSRADLLREFFALLPADTKLTADTVNVLNFKKASTERNVDEEAAEQAKAFIAKRRRAPKAEVNGQ